MQRYSAASGGSGVSNNSVSGASVRENARVDSSFQSANFSQNSRRPLPLHPYKLKVDKEPLNLRLGPPDFYPQTPNCPEETLTKEYLQTGYKETVEGIEEAREIVLTQVNYFTKPEIILKCKEAIRRRFRAINESRAQKRKAGQVYGVPLTGHLLIKPGSFPEQRPSNEDFRKKWIEALSSHTKRLRTLADHVPHGYRRKSLFEVLIRHNVPLLRATWLIKVTYLNQIRPASTSISPGSQDKAHSSRTELWTKDVLDYLQQLLDEYSSKDVSNVPASSRDQLSPGLLPGSAQKNDSGGVAPDVEEPSLLSKWCYMVHLLHWNYSEGLILPSVVVDWVLNQLQEKDSVDAFEMLLPVAFEFIDIISLSQTYTSTLVDIAIRSINDLSPGACNVTEASSRLSLCSAFVEILRYLMLSVPDTFVALDCFPLPLCVVPNVYSAHRTLKLTDDMNFLQLGEQDAYLRYMSLGYVAFTIQSHALNLANIANPGFQGQGSAKIVQILDKSFISGDARLAYSALFEDFSDLAIEKKWMDEVSPSLRSSLKWIGNIDLSLICSVFFLCEWATCGYRNFRTIPPENLKFSGMKDFSKVYAAVFLLKLKMEHICVSSQSSNAKSFASTGKAIPHENISSMASLENSFLKNKSVDHGKNGVDFFRSPGPLHDIIVCWLDQHETGKGGGFKHLQVLIMELIRNGIFYPPAYVRHLIVSGIMDRYETSFDLERRKRHRRILKQLPGACLFDVLEESKVLEAAFLNEVVQVFSNERQLVLHGSFGHSSHLANNQDNNTPFSVQRQNEMSFASKECSSTKPLINSRIKDHVSDLKILISSLLRIPYTYSSLIETQVDESPGSLKRLLGSSDIRFDSSEAMHTCDDCRQAKRQRLMDERSSSHQAIPSNRSDDEDTWWVRKGPKSLEYMKVEPVNKLAKNIARGRQKTGRKMQSLSQLAAARIEGSQGASTSHVCDNKITCPHNISGVEGKVPKDAARLKAIHLSDIGKTIKQLRLLEKRSISIWLSTSIKQLIDGGEKIVSKPSNVNGSFSIPLDERNAVRWKLGEEELSIILYILEISSDMLLAVKLLLWLFSKTLCGQINSGHAGRNITMLAKSRENHVFQVSEAFLLSALQRYENVILATDLLPELLSAAMHRTMSSLTPSGRPLCAAAFSYTRNLLKKYRDVPSVIKWEKMFRTTCDQRLLAADLDTGRLLDGDMGFSSGISGGISDFDEYIRQKVTGRVSRSGSNMKEIVQRHVEEAMHYFYGKERKPFAAGNSNSKNSSDNWDDAYQVAHEIVTGLSDCIRQNGGVALDGDPSVVSAVSSIVSNVGPTVVKVPDFISCNYQSLSSNSTSLNCVRYILYIHIISLCLLKEALGERFGRIFEIALATEASAAISGSLSPVRSHRNPYQLSPEAHDGPNHSSEVLNNSGNFVGLRVAKATAAVSALVLGAIVHGAVSLERMVTVFKLKEGLDVLQFIRSARSSSNGLSRSIGNFKLDHSIEVLIHWFRLLVGNTGTVCDGLVLEILGEPYIIALSRMQRILPLNLVLPPVYSIFAMIIWRPYILNTNIATREDIHLYHHLSLTINEIIRHQPFRDLCFQNTHAFYDLLATDLCDSEFAAMLELHNQDKQFKARAFVPLRARFFLNALIDCRLPPNTLIPEDGSLISESMEALKFAEMQQSLLNQLVHVLDTLQPAKFHWQWVELRLLLNEKALLDRIDMKDISLVEAIRSLSPNADNFAVSESDKFLSEIILARILVRPDAAPLYAEIAHLLGRSLEESLVMDIKWILAGSDVLSGRKSIRQQLFSVAQRKCLSTKALFWKPWGWSNIMTDVASNRGEKNKLDMIVIEEGEVVDDNSDFRRSSKLNLPTIDADSNTSSQQYLTEKAIGELILPCIDRSSTDLCNSFAGELIKQMNMIDQQINVFNRGGNKQPTVGPSGVEVSLNKGSSRKSMRGGSPGLGRRATTAADSSPPSAAALKASLWLRLQFLVRLLPFIFADRNLRQMLASIILHLMGSRFIHEDADLSFSMVHTAPLKRDIESVEASAAALFDYLGDSLFDTFLCVLHSLLSNCRPSWLKPKSTSKSSTKSPRDFSSFDRDALESMQADLDRMELPTAIRRRIQAAFPVLPPSFSMSLSPSYRPVTPPGLASPLQPLSSTTPAPFHRSAQNRPPVKSKALSAQDFDTEIDPWTLLEDGTACSAASNAGGSAGIVGGEHSNLKACSWLKGAVRIRRTDLTYVGALDDEN